MLGLLRLGDQLVDGFTGKGLAWQSSGSSGDSIRECTRASALQAIPRSLRPASAIQGRGTAVYRLLWPRVSFFIFFLFDPRGVVRAALGAAFLRAVRFTFLRSALSSIDFVFAILVLISCGAESALQPL